MWFRVFGTNDCQPEPPALLAHVRGRGIEVTGVIKYDDLGWLRIELIFGTADATWYLERFLAKEEGIRGELNTWAAWLETREDEPNHTGLMQHMISTTQLFTLSAAGEDEGPELVGRLCLALCQYLARVTAGVYQVDYEGFFAADGTLLLPE